jgi:hypothetical protein
MIKCAHIKNSLTYGELRMLKNTLTILLLIISSVALTGCEASANASFKKGAIIL